LQQEFTPMPEGFTYVPLNDVEALAKALDKPVAAANVALEGKGTDLTLARSMPPVCAVMLECIQGEAGVWPCTQEYLQAARKLTEERGILLIIDEVQSGCYRTGYPFSYQAYDILPDIVTLAKGIAGGVPMGALCARGAVGDVFGPGDHGSTFGGSALAVCAANAVLDVLGQEGFAEHVQSTGAYLREQLATLPHVSEVRGLGLMVGASLDVPQAAEVTAQALDAGFIINAPDPAILRFLPPLICEPEDIDALVAALREILQTL
jgi:acetylornithine aminotransferase